MLTQSRQVTKKPESFAIFAPLREGEGEGQRVKRKKGQQVESTRVSLVVQYLAFTFLMLLPWLWVAGVDGRLLAGAGAWWLVWGTGAAIWNRKTSC